MKNSPFFCAIFLTLCLSWTSCQFSTATSTEKSSDFRVLDVGQGDAMLVQSAGKNLLLDVGPPGQKVLLKLKSLGVKQLDEVMLSHQDLDHMGAISEILGQIPIAKITLGPDSGGARWDSITPKIASLHIPVDTLFRGDEAQLGDLKYRILWPQKSWGLSGNEASLVTLFELGNGAVLNMGDLPEEQEGQLLQWESGLKADLLKVGHHGSGGSTSLELLSQVNPYAAAISVGASNRYGHPDSSTLAHLLMFVPAAQIYRTDLLGDLHFKLGKSGITELP